MANPLLKSERYQNFGGINTKVSQYENAAFEFLDIRNFDFQTPAALTQRWGSTQYVGQTFAGGPNSLYEFVQLNNSSQIIIGATGGIWAGATTGNSQGLSLTTQSATLSDAYYIINYYVSSVTGIITFDYGAKYLGPAGSVYVGGDNASYGISPVNQSVNTASFKTMNNFLFIADGDKFVKYDGTTTYFVGLPPPIGASVAFNVGLSFVNGSTVGFPMGATLGAFYFYANYVNNRGFNGPVFPIGTFNANIALGGTTGVTLASSYSGTLTSFTNLFGTPLGYGISSINIFTYYDASAGATGTGSGAYLSYAQNNSWSIAAPIFLQNTAASGSTTTTVSFYPPPGRYGQSNVVDNIGPISQVPAYSPLSLTLIPGISGGISPDSGGGFAMVNYSPSILETHTARMFLAGFSTTPSVVWFSDVAEPEGYFPSSNFEVRTDDGDHVSALKAYTNRLYVFKTRSFHVLLGDSDANFFLQELSDEYGCLNNRCTVVYNDILLFLDRKGLMMYQGQITCVSNKVQPVFDTMNISAAYTTACVAHDKLRNQIIVSIPINGSATNNCVMVYDYLIGAWTRYDNINASCLQPMYGRNTTKNMFFGSYSGSVNWFGSSFLQDNGVGYSLYFKTAFMKPMGDSVQEQFRRLYLNANPGGTTFGFNINFFQDYGTSFVYQTTLLITAGNVQARIDFGISAKSLAFELETIQSNIPLQIFGFTIESRMQRRV